MPDTTPSILNSSGATKAVSSSTSGALGSASVGLSSASYISSLTSQGNSYNYALVIQLPVPVQSLDLNLSGAFILEALGLPKIPEAILSTITNAEAEFQKILKVATKLIRAIPELTVTILVKVGPLTVLNIQLVAEKVPVEVVIPDFVLDLPSIALAAGIDLNSLLALIPTPPPIIINVPVPVPSVTMPNVAVTGLQASATVSVTPPTITNPVRLPVL